MKFQLTLNFNKRSRLREIVEAKDRKDLYEVLKRSHRVLYANKDRVKVETLER